LSGCIWSTRNELKSSYPSTYLDILSALTVNSILLHTDGKITPQITIDFLTLDDDDGDLSNGTPHSDEILDGFGDHNMDFDGAVIWVDSATGDDVYGDGTDTLPYATIQKGIDEAASWGDTVLVGPGTYDAIEYDAKEIYIASTDGPQSTMITGDSTETLVLLEDGESHSAVLEGFRLEGGAIGVHASNANPTIRGNIFMRQYDAAIRVWIEYIAPYYEAQIFNNTILYSQGYGVDYFGFGSEHRIRNNIIAYNTVGVRPYVWDGIIRSSCATVEYNDVYGNTTNYADSIYCPPGEGSINEDPDFKPDSVSLHACSPCIDAGDPDEKFNDPDGSTNDMGALPRGYCCDMPGDINDDQVVDTLDIDALIDYLFISLEPPCCMATADVNGNCAVTIGDVSWLVSYVYNGTPAPVCGMQNCE
jgi:hypothetical protein